jgi:hypothetical protein
LAGGGQTSGKEGRKKSVS